MTLSKNLVIWCLLVWLSTSNVEGLIGKLNKVTVGTSGGFFAELFGCGAYRGVKIKIQKPNHNFCSVALPAFSGGDTMTLDGTNLGDCRSVDFDVGLTYIRFWVYSTETTCIDTLTLRFSTPQGQVTFRQGAVTGSGSGGYTFNSEFNSRSQYVKKQSD
jgi:hypothetical protein